MSQAYHPYRSTLLTREQLRALSRPRPGVVVRDTAVRWLVMLAAFSAAAIWTNPWVVAAVFVVVGVNFYGLMIIGHDGLHRRLFEDTGRNDLFNDLFCVGPIGAITRLNRDNHMTHHRVTCLPDDPDRHKYIHDGKAPPFGFLAFLSGLANVWPTMRNIFLGKKGEGAGTGRSYTPRDLAILIGWQAFLIVALSWSIGWWAYPVLWIAPVYVFGYCGDLIRVFCEHSVLTSDEDADESMRLISYSSSWLERQVFAPQNMNFHMAHHLWPSIPYFNLKEADRIVRESPAVAANDPRLVWRRSYIAFILSYVRWRMAGHPALSAA